MVTQATRCVSCWTLLLIFQGAGTLATPPTRTCPQYVKENGTLTCTCTGVCTSGQPTFTWQNGAFTVSQNASLVKTNVKRQDNGSQFTCQMNCTGESSSAEYVLQVSYGPSSDHLTIKASGDLIVNSTANLTCLATQANPTPKYTWFDVTCVDEKSSTCSFVPQPTDDRKNVTCKAFSGESSSEAPPAITRFTLDVKYPPTDPPLIQGYSGQTLTNGSTLSCIVKGGKPLVQSVHFSCDGHLDQLDSFDPLFVTSSVTIDASQILEETTKCVCTATWSTQPELYLLKNTVTIQTEYKAHVNIFTINDTRPSLEVVGISHETLLFTCNASGMPLPDIKLYNMTDGALIHGNSRLSYTMYGVTIQDMGTYTCSAGNVYGTSDTHVQLLVTSLPQGIDTSNSKDNPTELTEDGLNFTVMMYPDLCTFNYTFYGRGGNQTSEAIPVDMFNGTAVREVSSSPVVVCSIKPLHRITEEKLGLYDVLVVNDLGTYQYFFEIKKTMHIGPDSRRMWEIPVAFVASILGLAAVVVFTVKLKTLYKSRVKPKESTRTKDSEFIS